MKVFLTFFFILTLISSALAGVRVESHVDHQHEEVSTDDHSFHMREHASSHASQKEKKDPKSSKECPHLHVHCTSLCCGIVFSNNYSVQAPSSLLTATNFLYQNLLPQTFSNSLYRPPIA